ncbi:protein of unknown function (plasmid) [Pararobbsia alpina]|uniref:hypothetical protein n=1 Tax=Pararobbsia alpina TaxID=621374 RepID=UPI0039A718B5
MMHHFSSDRSSINMLGRLLQGAKDAPALKVEVRANGDTSLGHAAVQKLIQDLRVRRIETFELRMGAKTMHVIVNYFGE